MDLQNALNAVTPYTENSYAEFAKIIDKPYIELSFWGNRNVYVLGYEGSIPLRQLAQVLIDLIKSNEAFSENDIQYGLVIEKKIWDLFEINEEQEKRACCITKFFIALIYTFTGDEDIYNKILESKIFSNLHLNKRINK